ncbi:hypothetical protein, partial [Micropruina sp.]|uniref:hypothetical protein n=1 Tax=Micropruina sp. TaxID=2737536 RepID=UPI0039E3394F
MTAHDAGRIADRPEPRHDPASPPERDPWATGFVGMVAGLDGEAVRAAEAREAAEQARLRAELPPDARWRAEVALGLRQPPRPAAVIA